MKSLRVRFDAKVDRSGGPDACWPWTASVVLGGYGQIGIPGRSNGMAHRVAWELSVGGIPDDLQVLHRCDNRRCCNPAHLFLGTQRDNVHDMMGKGRERMGTARGEQIGNSKITEAMVREIRELYATTMITQEDLATQFDIGQSAVSAIVRRATWRHIP